MVGGRRREPAAAVELAVARFTVLARSAPDGTGKNATNLSAPTTTWATTSATPTEACPAPWLAMRLASQLVTP
jgi:hypothetical protein